MFVIMFEYTKVYSKLKLICLCHNLVANAIIIDRHGKVSTIFNLPKRKMMKVNLGSIINSH